MRLEPFNRGLGDFSVMEDLKKGKIHMVFVAVNALTFFNAFAVDNPFEETENGISSEQASRMCKLVNEKNETGTLYPKLNISIIPLSRYQNRHDWNNEIALERNIKDVFKANSLYIKSQKIIFAFEARFDFNNNLAVRVLEKVANEIPNDEILTNIYFIGG